MKLEKNIILGLTVSIFVLLIQNQEALAQQTITIKEHSADSACKMDKSCFSLTNLSIKEGQVVTWYNADSVSHSIMGSDQNYGSSGIVSSGIISSGESYSHRFETSAYFSYHCIIHPWMQGMVLVE